MTEWALAGKLLAPYAGKLATQLLGNKATLRVRVLMRVRRRSGIDFPRRPYLRWLRTLDAEALALPVEQASSNLALTLEAYLAANDQWSRREPARRETDAASIVGLTYIVLLLTVDREQARALQEQWSKARHARTLEAVEKAARAWGGARLPKPQFVGQQRRMSDERRALRLAALGFDDPAALQLLGIAPLRDVDVPPGGVRLLLGPLGSGKSEVAERWFRQKLGEFDALDSAPVPAWITARDVVGDLESAVAQALGGRDVLSQYGAAVVLDGLDETDTARATHLLGQARILTSAVPQSSVLATSRAGVTVTALGTDDLRTAEPLTTEGAAQLIQHAAGLPQPPGWDWPESLRETVRRPFFALAAASELRGGRRVGGRAGLMRAVVDSALVRGHESAQASEPELFAMLVRLAVETVTTDTAADARAWPVPQRLRLTATRLVIESVDRLSFSLPLFQQWFAAQALLDGDVAAKDLTSSTSAFDRWRWSLAIAVASGSTDRVDEIVGALIEWNPGAGAWVLRQASSGGFSLSGQAAALDEENSRQRLATALVTWDNSLGELSAECFPHRADGRVRAFGVSIDGRRLTYAWWMGADRPDLVLPLLPAAHPAAPQDPPDWRLAGGTTVAPEDIWPWLLFRDEIKRELPGILCGSDFLWILGDGVWRKEFLYDAARTVLGQRSVFHEPMDVAQLRAATDRLISAVENPRTTLYQLQGNKVDGQTLLELVAWLDSVEETQIRRPWPTPDLRTPAGGLIWDVYSDARLLEVTTEVLGAAVEVYGELATVPFSRFDWTLGLYGAGDIGVLGSLNRNRDAFEPVINYEVLPLEIARQESAGRHASSNGRAFVDLLPAGAEFNRDWVARTGQLREWMQAAGAPPFWRLSAGWSVLKVTGNRPATAQAVDWLWSDLKPLGLASLSQPRIE